MNVYNYNNISLIRNYLINLNETKILNCYSPYNIVARINFDYLMIDIYLYADYPYKDIILEFNLYDKGIFCFEWPYDVRIFKGFVFNPTESEDGDEMDEEVTKLEQFLEYVYSLSNKHLMMKKYGLK